jgi:hypothetical protein
MLPRLDVTSPAMHYRFVDRVEEIRLVYEYLGSLRDGLEREALIVFKGMPGIGKSSLLRELRWRLSREGLHSTYIDFKPLCAQESPLRAALTALLEQLLFPVSAPATDSTEHLVEKWRSEIAQWSRSSRAAPPVLFFDALEECPNHMRRDLERDILVPALETRRVLVIATSRQSLEWDEFLVRRAVLEVELKPFAYSATREQIGDESLAVQIQDLTGGIPGANVEVFEELQGRIDDFHERREELTLNLVEKYIFEQLVRGVEPTVRRAIQMLSPLRQFDYDSVSTILSRMLPDDWAKGTSARAFRQLVRDMQRTTQLVEWDREKRSFVIVRPLRYLLDRYLCVDFHRRQQDDQYRAIHQLALQIYEKRALQEPVYVWDVLYHTVRLWTGSRLDPTLNQELLDILTRCLQRATRDKDEPGSRASQDMELIRRSLDDDDLKEALRGSLEGIRQVLADFDL